jgi:hypothetical protein
MRFIAKTLEGAKYIEGNNFNWMKIPITEHIKWVKIQGPKKSYEYVFKNASGYYFMNEAVATPNGNVIVAKIIGAVDGRRGSVEEHRITRHGKYSVKRFSKDDLLDKIKKDQFNSQIIRMGI